MKWKLIILASLIGIPVSIASVYWLPRTGTFIAWVIAYIAVAFIIAANTTFKKYAWNALVAAYLMLIYNGLIHYFLFDTYVANHPELGDKFLIAKNAVIGSNIIFGFIAAKLLMVLTFFARLILGKKRNDEVKVA